MSEALPIEVVLSLYEHMSTIRKKELQIQYPYTLNAKDLTRTLNEIDLVYSRVNKFYRKEKKKEGGGHIKNEILVVTM